jgi:hypothetical protein
MMGEVSAAELLDPIYYSLFPNVNPWVSFIQIFYRFRSYGDNPEDYIQQSLFKLTALAGKPRPPAEDAMARSPR